MLKLPYVSKHVKVSWGEAREFAEEIKAKLVGGGAERNLFYACVRGVFMSQGRNALTLAALPWSEA